MSNLITISQNNVDVRNAKGNQVLFSAQYPFAKLDKTNTVSFQNITLFFNNEPPNPSGGSFGPVTTLVYSFPHGYTYVPSTWFLMQHVGGDTSSQKPIYQQEGGTISLVNALTVASLRMQADDAKCYFYVDKTSDGTNFANIQAVTLVIRVYVFAGDLTGTAAGS